MSFGRTQHALTSFPVSLNSSDPRAAGTVHRGSQISSAEHQNQSTLEIIASTHLLVFALYQGPFRTLLPLVVSHYVLVQATLVQLVALFACQETERSIEYFVSRLTRPDICQAKFGGLMLR